MSVKFHDFSVNVQKALDDRAEQFLYEASESLKTQVKQLTKVKSGQLKGSWAYEVNLEAMESRIGSPLENAIWNEFGTGEYAANGDGRKGGWSYKDDEGEWHHTKGKIARHTLQKAFEAKKKR